MNINNKKGFTLVELLAVIIVLIIIILLAVTIVKRYTLEAKEKSIEANMASFVKATNMFVVELKGTENEVITGAYTYSQLIDLGLKMSGTKPEDGGVFITNSSVYYACLVYGDYYVKYENGKVKKPQEGICDSNFATDMEFQYTGKEEVVTITTPGTYKIEAWGAQGGTTVRWYTIPGGYGGYAVGYIDLVPGDKLYINVGGKGTGLYATRAYVEGGYNGGGQGYTSSSDRVSGSGGGATSIAFESGLLADLEDNKDQILMVSGGGAGAWTSSDTRWQTNVAGSGGGYIGGTGNGRTSSNSVNQTCDGATQESGYAFGRGGIDNNTSEHVGGGGGYYGGNVNGYSGGGGSGYIGNERLYNKIMYCYGCPESDDTETKTRQTRTATDSPTSECAKKGDGFVRITMETY